jgi:hypothetical protein
MRWTSKLELVRDDGITTTHQLAAITRPMTDLRPEEIGLTLEEGRALVQDVERTIIADQIHACPFLSYVPRLRELAALQGYTDEMRPNGSWILSLPRPPHRSCPCQIKLGYSPAFFPLSELIPRRTTRPGRANGRAGGAARGASATACAGRSGQRGSDRAARTHGRSRCVASLLRAGQRFRESEATPQKTFKLRIGWRSTVAGVRCPRGRENNQLIYNAKRMESARVGLPAGGGMKDKDLKSQNRPPRPLTCSGGTRSSPSEALRNLDAPPPGDQTLQSWNIPHRTPVRQSRRH